MNRRTFVTLGATSLCVLPSVGFGLVDKKGITKPAWLLNWIAVNDKNLANYTPLRITASGHPYEGGYMNEADIPSPQTTSGFLMLASMLYTCPESAHYQKQELVPLLDAAARALLVMQHTDGTIDLPETNFHSTPDTAFVLENIVPAYKFLNQSKGNGRALGLLRTFLKNAGEALIVGGIHTPNHRWVVSAALTRLDELFPDGRYTRRIDQWLAEHIDIDPDGQYTEKSTNSYSPIVNRSLIIMAQGLDRPDLLEPVRRNLLMTRYYVHPNGEVVTEASNRQDKGTISNMSRYYYGYRYMALHDQNGELAAMCRLIEKTCPKEQLAGFLPYFLEEPTLWNELPTSQALPTSYAKAFPYSGVVRIRRDNWDCTLLSNNGTWLTFHKGNAVLQGMRVAASFFGKGQFQTDKIEQQANAWVMRQSLDGPYYQPMPPDKLAADGDWDKMPRADRPQTEIQTLTTTIKATAMPNGMQISLDISGTDGVPVALELIFRAGGTLKGVVSSPKKENAYLLAAESGTYTVGTDTLHFGPGKAEHKGVQLRGALPAMDAPTVYLTGFTPFRHTLVLS